MNMLNESYNMYLKILKIEPNNYEIYNEIGNIYYSIYKYEESFIFYDKSMKINPNKYSLKKIVQIFRYLSKYSEGIDYCLKYLINYDNSPIVLVLLTQLYLDIADYNEYNKCIYYYICIYIFY